MPKNCFSHTDPAPCTVSRLALGFLFYAAAGAASSMEIYARLPDSQLVTLDVQPSDTIQAVKGKIEDKTALPAVRQILSFSSVDLQNSRTLSDYNIQKMATLTVTLTAPSPGAIAYGFRQFVQGLKVQ